MFGSRENRRLNTSKVAEESGSVEKLECFESRRRSVLQPRREKVKRKGSRVKRRMEGTSQEPLHMTSPCFVSFFPLLLGKVVGLVKSRLFSRGAPGSRKEAEKHNQQSIREVGRGNSKKKERKEETKRRL